MAVIQPLHTHIPYQCAKFGDNWALFNDIFDVCDVYLVTSIYTHISVFYFPAISRDIDRKCLQDTYWVVINSPNKIKK